MQRMTALTMETRGLLAEWDAKLGRLTVSGAAKLPFFNRRAMAAMMKLPEEAVDYIEYDVGGGFGARGEFYPEDFLVAFARPQVRPSGEMDRGPPRAPHGDRSFARDRMRPRDCVRPRTA